MNLKKGDVVLIRVDPRRRGVVTGRTRPTGLLEVRETEGPYAAACYWWSEDELTPEREGC